MRSDPGVLMKSTFSRQNVDSRTHIAQNVPGSFRDPSVKTKETSQLKLSDG